jgi:hypothetical protein
MANYMCGKSYQRLLAEQMLLPNDVQVNLFKQMLHDSMHCLLLLTGKTTHATFSVAGI